MLLLNKYLKKGKLTIVFLFLFNNIFIAQNLISNGSFEQYTSPIDCGAGGFDNASAFPINHVVNDWSILNSPDYYTANCTGGWYSTPSNIFGNQLPKDGNSMAGFELFHKNGETKEYIYQHLLSPLQAGKIYCLSFFVSRADRKEYAIKNIGAMFSVSTPTLYSNYYVNKTPQIVNQSGFLIDTISWVQIQGCYTALGGEQYVTIGNFNSNANTDTIFSGTNNPIPLDPQYAYYFIDDITLIDQSTVGTNELDVEDRFNVYPNPTKDVLNISLESENCKYSFIELKDICGKVLLSTPYINQINISNLSQGLYFLNLKSDKSEKVIKIIRQ